MAFTASFPKIVKYQIHQALHISLCAPHFNGFGEEHAIGKADDENTTRFQNPKSFPQDVHWSLHVLNRNSHKNLGRVLCTKKRHVWGAKFLNCFFPHLSCPQDHWNFMLLPGHDTNNLNHFQNQCKILPRKWRCPRNKRDHFGISDMDFHLPTIQLFRKNIFVLQGELVPPWILLLTDPPNHQAPQLHCRGGTASKDPVDNSRKLGSSLKFRVKRCEARELAMSSNWFIPCTVKE